LRFNGRFSGKCVRSSKVINFHVPGKELFGALIFTGCGSNENVKLPIKTMQNHQLAYCFFIHHWIPERKGTVDFMVPVQCQYPLLDSSLKQ